MTHGKIAAAVLAAVCMVALTVSSATGTDGRASQNNRVLFPSNCNNPSYKPKSITITCADDNFVIRGISWSSWGTSTAKGRGTASINACEPNCAAGRFQQYPVTVTLSVPRQCGASGSRQFTRVAFTFTGQVAPGYRKSDRDVFGCGSSGGGNQN